MKPPALDTDTAKPHKPLQNFPARPLSVRWPPKRTPKTTARKSVIPFQAGIPIAGNSSSAALSSESEDDSEITPPQLKRATALSESPKEESQFVVRQTFDEPPTSPPLWPPNSTPGTNAGKSVIPFRATFPSTDSSITSSAATQILPGKTPTIGAPNFPPRPLSLRWPPKRTPKTTARKSVHPFRVGIPIAENSSSAALSSESEDDSEITPPLQEQVTPLPESPKEESQLVVGQTFDEPQTEMQVENAVGKKRRAVSKQTDSVVKKITTSVTRTVSVEKGSVKKIKTLVMHTVRKGKKVVKKKKTVRTQTVRLGKKKRVDKEEPILLEEAAAGMQSFALPPEISGIDSNEEGKTFFAEETQADYQIRGPSRGQDHESKYITDSRSEDGEIVPQAHKYKSDGNLDL